MLAGTALQTVEHADVVVDGAEMSELGGACRPPRQDPGAGFAAREMRWAGAVLAALTCFAAILIASPAAAQRTGGRSDTEIRIGNTMPYSGPASAYGIIGKTIAAYFNKINAEGGIRGHRINFYFLR